MEGLGILIILILYALAPLWSFLLFVAAVWVVTVVICATISAFFG